LKFTDLFISEKERLPLFAPVILGIGIIFGVFFPFFHWGYIWIFNISIISLVVLLYGRAKILAFSILIFGLGVYVAQVGGILETNLLTQKKFLTEEYENIEFTAVVSSMDDTHPVMKNMRRVSFKDVKNENINFIQTIKMTCSVKMSDGILPGDIVRIRGKLTPFKPPAMPGTFDQFQYNALTGTDATGIAYYIEKIGKTSDCASKLAKMRRELTKAMLRKMSKYGSAGAIASALLTGDKSAIAPDVRDKFVNSGTAHILAVSGLHMSIVASVIFFVLYKVLQYLSYFWATFSPRRLAAIVTIPATFLYLALSGFSPSATRAFIMTSVFLVGVSFGRGVLSLRSVAVAGFLILLFNPGSIFLVSFQLSFCAVVALISFYETFQHKINNLKIKDCGILDKIIFYILSTLITTLIASIATLPISVAVFNRLSLSGMLGNLVAIPVISFFVIPVGLFSLMSGFFTNLPIEFLAYILNKLCAILSWIAEIPGSNLLIKSPQMPALYAIIAGGIILCILKSNLRFYGIIPIFWGFLFWFCRERPDIVFIPNKDVVCFIENSNFFTSSLRKARRSSVAIQRNLGFSGKLTKKEFYSKKWKTGIYPRGLYIWSKLGQTKQLAERRHPYCPAYWTHF